MYQLTEPGHSLEKSVIELGKWGSQFMPPTPQDAHVLHLGSYALTLKTFFRPDEAPGLDETCKRDVDKETLQARFHDGELDWRRARP